MFKETKIGQTHSCTHKNTNKSGICDACLRGSKRRVEYMAGKEKEEGKIQDLEKLL